MMMMMIIIIIIIIVIIRVKGKEKNVRVSQVTCSWTKRTSKVTIRNISFNIQNFQI